MDRKKGPKTVEKNTILTQLKNVQKMSNQFVHPKIFQKNHFLKTNIFGTKDAAIK